nr:unnamed protein product [Callosobruchus analis]CAI5870037.1 unnamed protein product [Callosobruchus analis]CAI5870039.1 unnamed protein product [Callosobruchus analis]
MGQRNLP